MLRLKCGIPSKRSWSATGHWRLCQVMTALAFLSTVGCSQRLAPSDCDALLARYVLLLAQSDRPETSSMQRFRMQQRAREMASRDPRFGNCGATISRSEFECAMSAPSTDAFEQCLM